MKQKTTSIRYLTLGLIINLFVQLSACTKTARWEQVGNFYFINNTDYTISYPVGYENFNILPKSTFFFKQEIARGGTTREITEASDYFVPLQNFNGIIKFDYAKCLNNNSITDEHSIRNIKNYIAERINENAYKFTFTFTEADYNRAVACP